MNYFKEKVLPILIGAVISAVFAIVIRISSDLVPSIMPALNKLPVELYIKLILLLLLLWLIVTALLIIIVSKSQTHKPHAMKGSYSGLNWVAELDYNDKGRDVSVELRWICPIHKTFLGCKDAEVPECSYCNLFAKSAIEPLN